MPISLHDGDGFGTNAAGVGAGGMDFEAVAGVVAEQAFRHLASGRSFRCRGSGLAVCMAVPPRGTNVRVRLQAAQTESMTGTSTRTPTTVAERRAGIRAEERDGGGHRQFEEIAGADQRAGRGDGVLHFQPASSGRRRGDALKYTCSVIGTAISSTWKEPAGDVVGLKREDEDQSRQQRGDGDRRESRQQRPFEPCPSPRLRPAASAEQRAGRQGNHDEDDHRAEQHVERHGERRRPGAPGTARWARRATSMMRSLTETCTSV